MAGKAPQGHVCIHIHTYLFSTLLVLVLTILETKYICMYAW